MSDSTEEATAQIQREGALDRLRSLLGPAFGASSVTTEYGAPAALTGAPHSGIDLAAAEGTPIQEPIGGTVESYTYDNAGGNQLVVRTPQGYREVYAHLSAVPAFVATNPGESISPGQTIGYVGQSGQATGPHLHYEVTKPGGDIGTLLGTIDPLTFIGEFTDQRPPSPDAADRRLVPGPGNDYGLGAPYVEQIKDRLNQYATQVALGQISAPEAASRLRTDFPGVPVKTLQAISYGRASDVAHAFDAAPGVQGVDNLGKIVGPLTDARTWARVGITAGAAGLIILGVVLYASAKS